MADQPAPTDQTPEQDQEAGQRRGVDPNKVIGKLTQQLAGLTQELAVAHVYIDDLEADKATLKEANAGLRAELVAATSGQPAAPAAKRTGQGR